MNKPSYGPYLLGALAALGLVSLGVGAPAQARSEHTSAAKTTAKTGTGSDPAASDLQFLREEEKLARDVYITLHKRWNIQAFDNISGAEQRHMDRLKRLMDARKIVDPVVNDKVGAFTNQALAKLFTELTARGGKSQTEALTVGALVEELDIYDIQTMRSRTKDRDVLQTYDVLECGSRNHLRAFSRLLGARSVTYKPVHLSQTAYDAIIAGKHERCGRKYGGGGGGRRGGQR